MRIAVYAFDGITMFHLATPLMVFGEVERLGLADGWSTVVWSDRGAPVRTLEGLLIDDVRGPEVLDDADLVVLPSWPSDLPAATPELTDAIRAAHGPRDHHRGACVSAPSRWRTADSWTAVPRSPTGRGAADLTMHRPAVVVDPSALYIDHGDVLTSAGTASALDACLHVVRDRLGATARTTRPAPRGRPAPGG